MKIGSVEIDSRLALAPMAGVTDLAFRTICRRFGAGLTCTEMVSSRALVYGDKKTLALLRLGPYEHPAAAQIFGNDPEIMAAAAVIAARISGADIIDINMGCPTPKIVSNGDGCALMRDPALAANIVRGVVKSSPLPVTVKIRSGWDKGSINAVEVSLAVQEAGASAVCVHGRTKVQMYSGRADWDTIADVKKNLSIPVIANGDVVTGEDAPRILKYTNADMAMIGRGALGDPWIFSQAAAALSGLPSPAPPTLDERCGVAVRQFELAAADKGERPAALEARRHLAWYLRGLPHSSHYRRLASQVSSLEDIYTLVKAIKRDLR